MSHLLYSNLFKSVFFNSFTLYIGITRLYYVLVYFILLCLAWVAHSEINLTVLLCFPCSSLCVLQVAEMHGELIEFNERLYRSLMAKDHLIVQMRQELIDLRGPVRDCTRKHTIFI